MIPQPIVNELALLFKRRIEAFAPVSGGSINKTYSFRVGLQQYFLKFNRRNVFPDIISNEVEGLKAIASLQCIKTPEIIYFRQLDSYEMLVMPFIPSQPVNRQFWMDFGHQLGQMHHLGRHEQFGWGHANYIGSLAQDNRWKECFHDFWVERRIRPQLRLAIDDQLLSLKDSHCFENLFSRAEEIFPAMKPSLVHGDLWSGNFIANKALGPVLIDPSIHYGAAEADIAFTYLFGGFDHQFYKAYDEANPLAPAFEERIKIYNLYPLLVHLNLFGASYFPAIQKVICRFE